MNSRSASCAECLLNKKPAVDCSNKRCPWHHSNNAGLVATPGKQLTFKIYFKDENWKQTVTIDSILPGGGVGIKCTMSGAGEIQLAPAT